MTIRSSSPNQPKAEVEVQLNSPIFCVWSMDSPARACTIAAHAGRPPDARQSSVGRVGSRAFAYTKNGRSEARQRDSHSPGSPQARPQGGARTDPRAAAGPTRLPAHREGVRPAPGGAEVRAREGESHPHALPHLAEQ